MGRLEKFVDVALDKVVSLDSSWRGWWIHFGCVVHKANLEGVVLLQWLSRFACWPAALRDRHELQDTNPLVLVDSPLGRMALRWDWFLARIGNKKFHWKWKIPQIQIAYFVDRCVNASWAWSAVSFVQCHIRARCGSFHFYHSWGRCHWRWFRWVFVVFHFFMFSVLSLNNSRWLSKIL